MGRTSLSDLPAFYPFRPYFSTGLPLIIPRDEIHHTGPHGRGDSDGHDGLDDIPCDVRQQSCRNGRGERKTQTCRKPWQSDQIYKNVRNDDGQNRRTSGPDRRRRLHDERTGKDGRYEADEVATGRPEQGCKPSSRREYRQTDGTEEEIDEHAHCGHRWRQTGCGDQGEEGLERHRNRHHRYPDEGARGHKRREELMKAPAATSAVKSAVTTVLMILDLSIIVNL